MRIALRVDSSVGTEVATAFILGGADLDQRIDVRGGAGATDYVGVCGRGRAGGGLGYCGCNGSNDGS